MKIGNLKVYGIIYKITNLKNKKVYIGQTDRARGFKDRYCAHGNGIERVYNYYKRELRQGKICNNHLMKSIEKYGFDNFKVDECFDVAFSRTELDIKERIYIEYYNSTNNELGYNILKGGTGGAVTENRMRKTCRPIYNVKTKECFYSIEEAERYYNVGIDMKKTNNFKYIKDNGKDSKGRYKENSVLCLNDSKIFKNVLECYRYYTNNNQKKSGGCHISEVCNGKREYTRFNNKKYYFMYTLDYYCNSGYITSEENANKIIENYNYYKKLGFYLNDKNTLKDKKLFVLNLYKTIIMEMISEGKTHKDIADFLNCSLNLKFKFVEKNIKDFLINQ